MADQGFKIYGIFYPLVSYEDWLNQDFVLATELTEKTTEQIFDDPIMLEQALVAIAFRHVNAAAKIDEVIAFIGGLKPSEIEDVGFESQEPASPLPSSDSNESAGSSTASSDASTEPIPETSPTDSSGIPGSGTGSPA